MEERNFRQRDLDRRMNSLEAVAEAGFAKPLNLSQTATGYTVEVRWACADTDSITLEYIISGGRAEGVLHAIAALTDDHESSYFSYSGSGDKNGNVQRAYFNYQRDGLLTEAESINLHLEITATASLDYYNQLMMWMLFQRSIAHRKERGEPIRYAGQTPEEPQRTDEVFGPFIFDFSVPIYNFSESIVSQTVIVDDVPVALERVRITPLRVQFVFNFDQAANPQILAKDLFTGMRLAGEGWELPAMGGDVKGDDKAWSSSNRMFLCDKTGEATLLIGNSGHKRMEGYIPWAMPRPDGTPTPIPPPTWREIVLPGPWVFKFTMPVVEPQR